MASLRRQRTKIVATVGPACATTVQLAALLRAGVDVFRLNLSHGTRSAHADAVARIREAERRLGEPVAILADLQGPRIRLGVLPEAGVALRRGERARLVAVAAGEGGGTRRGIPVAYPRFARDVSVGDRVLVADGAIELRVRRIAGNVVECAVVVGGLLLSRKGINLPDGPVSLGTLTAKDRDDLAFAAKVGIDHVGISFVREARDLERARAILRAHGSAAGLVAKIERREAVERLGEIVRACDAVMVARGDLAVELGEERVPILQKRILAEAMRAGRPSITATQMLESMLDHPRPTRAEASDVANAIFDGTGAVMLSGETAVGRHPVATVRTMARIVAAAEHELVGRGFPRVPVSPALREETALARAAERAASDVGARAIVTLTDGGASALAVSRERPNATILACTARVAVARRLTLAWGVVPRIVASARSLADLSARGEEAARASGLAGDASLVVLAGRHDVPGGGGVLRVLPGVRARRTARLLRAESPLDSPPSRSTRRAPRGAPEQAMKTNIRRSNKKRAKKVGFRTRSKSVGGRRIIRRKRKKSGKFRVG